MKKALAKKEKKTAAADAIFDLSSTVFFFESAFSLRLFSLFLFSAAHSIFPESEANVRSQKRESRNVKRAAKRRQ